MLGAQGFEVTIALAIVNSIDNMEQLDPYTAAAVPAAAIGRAYGIDACMDGHGPPASPICTHDLASDSETDVGDEAPLRTSVQHVCKHTTILAFVGGSKKIEIWSYSYKADRDGR